jgi:HlyD family secretion protein
MRGRKILYLAGGAALVVGLGAWALRGNNDVQYRTANVQRGDLVYSISATGSPNAVVTVQVGSQVSGNIQQLFADFNTRVTKGQVVAQIDPQLFQARVDQSRANLSAAQASVANAQAQIARNQADVAGAKAAVTTARANALKAKSAVDDARVKLGRKLALVKEGVLSRDDGDTAQATYDQAAAAYDAARAQVSAAEQNVTAVEAQVKVAQTQLTSSQAQVRQAQASLQQAEVDLANTTIRAPVDGVVVARRVDVGQTVAASMQAPTLFEIAQDLTNMQVDTNVSEADIGRVQVGQNATFTVDAYPGQIFRGKVTSIRKAAINVQNVVTYDVVIGVANPDLRLFPGMTANVKILVERRDSVLKIPNAALRYRPSAEAPQRASGGRKQAATPQQTVWVLDPKSEHPKAVPVTLGLTDGNFTEVSGSSLQEGDPVVVAAIGKKESATSASSSPFGGGAAPGGGRKGGF